MISERSRAPPKTKRMLPTLPRPQHALVAWLKVSPRSLGIRSALRWLHYAILDRSVQFIFQMSGQERLSAQADLPVILPSGADFSAKIIMTMRQSRMPPIYGVGTIWLQLLTRRSSPGVYAFRSQSSRYLTEHSLEEKERIRSWLKKSLSLPKLLARWS